MTEEVIVPDGWSATTLGELGKYLNGRAFKKSEWGKTGRPIIRIQDLTGSNTNPNYFKGTVEDRYVVRQGDFLISWAATLGAYIWEGQEGVLNQHIFKVESNIDQRFHYHLVREKLAELVRSAHGSGMVHITKGTFDDTPVVVPQSPKTQRQVSQLIERSDALHDEARRRTESAHNLIDRFRQAVRVAACSGRLTEGWRNAHPDVPSVEQALGELQLNRRGRRGAKDAAVDIALPDLPESYVLANIGDTATLLEYGTSQKCGDDSRGVAVLRMGNITDEGILRLGDLKYHKLNDEVRKLTLHDGDLLFNRTNSPERVGKAAVFHEEERMSFASYLIRLRFHPDVADPDFVNLWINSAWGRAWARQVKTDGVSQSNINGSKLAAMPLPLPPVKEQREIVARANAMLALAETLGERVQNAEQVIERSAQAVLRKAIRGELAL